MGSGSLHHQATRSTTGTKRSNSAPCFNNKIAAGDTTPTPLELTLFGSSLPEMDGEWAATRDKVITTMRQRWAASTTASRNRLFNELTEIAATDPAVPLQTWAAMLVERKNVAPQTKLTYAKSLHTIIRSMGGDVALLATYIAGLRAIGAEIPLHQATPMSAENIATIECALPTKVALMLAWKTASRVDEIARLTPESIISSAPDEIIIWFGQNTKTSRLQPFQPHLLQVVSGRWTDFLHEHLPAALQSWPTSSAIGRAIPRPMTMHSIKHGAAQVLIKAAAEGRLETSLIPLVLKHSTAQALPQVTLRYLAGDKIAVARALRTAEATRML